MSAMPELPPLIDPFGRRVTYLRISVTDRCDFRCVYCMGEEVDFARREQSLSLEEILFIARAFIALGVQKIRLTGGEPLTRRNILWLIQRLGVLPGLREVTLTTNGSLLEKYADQLSRAGVRRINVSLDSLRPERFRRLTRVGDLRKVLRGLEAARQAGFERIKLNVVPLRGLNHDEIPDLVEFAMKKGFNISFIEEMPLGRVGDHDRAGAYYSSEAVKRDLARHFTLIPTTETSGGPARYYRLPDSETRIGLISPHSHNFCADCNRVRLTTEGRLLLCLGQDDSVDLKAIIRERPHDPAHLEHCLRRAMRLKPRGHDFNLEQPVKILPYMNHTGG